MPGLWAAGEVACTGVHGANRLASNSLLEALVFGARVARSVGEALPHLRRPAGALEVPPLAPALAGDDEPTAAAEAGIRRLMWEKAGLVRTGDGLREALAAIEALAGSIPAGAAEARNRATVARLVATAALARPESRGAHFRADHPLADPAWRRRILLTPEGGAPRLETEPVDAPPAARGGLRVSETPPLLPLLYEDVVRRALLEDLGRAGDVTTDAIVPPDLAGAGGASSRERPAAWPASSRRSTPSACSTRSAGSTCACATAATPRRATRSRASPPRRGRSWPRSAPPSTCSAT